MWHWLQLLQKRGEQLKCDNLSCSVTECHCPAAVSQGLFIAQGDAYTTVDALPENTVVTVPLHNENYPKLSCQI